MFKKVNLIVFFILTIYSLPTYADHVVGGYVSMKQLDREAGKFKITLKLYVDLNLYAGQRAEIVLRGRDQVVYIQEKGAKDKQDFFLLNYISGRPVVYNNPGCAKVYKLNIYEHVLEREVELNLKDYANEKGYYLQHETCCRNIAITNIVDPDSIGTFFRTEIPALLKNNEPIKFSTPYFDDINGDFICKNKLIKIDFSAIDSDGDSLAYEMTDPLIGNIRVIVNGEVPYTAEGKPVPWKSGYGANNAIKGRIPLSIDSKGKLYVITNQEGLFSFAVSVSKIRDGVVISKVRHDFQIPVVDCDFTPPVIPEIKINGMVTKSAKICKGQSATIEATNDSNTAYQWQFAGNNLKGKDDIKLKASRVGEYSLVLSSKTVCISDSTIGPFKLESDQTRPTINKSTKALCEGSAIELKVDSPESVMSYVWYDSEDNQIKKGQKVEINQKGKYYLESVNPLNGCVSERDSIQIEIGTNIQTSQPNQAGYVFCQGDSVKLETLNGSGYEFLWYKNDSVQANITSNIFIVKNGGKYYALVKDQAGCKKKTGIFEVKLAETELLTIDQIPEQCLEPGKKVGLRANIQGGKFTGSYVTTNVFDVALAGVGKHEVGYEVKPTGGCLLKQNIFIAVSSPPTIKVSPPVSNIKAGESVTLELLSDKKVLSYHWKPHDFLDNHDSKIVISLPDKSVTYNIEVISEFGCKLTTQAKINVEQIVIEKESIEIDFPRTFTPNGDGINDEFEIFGIENFPNSIIKVYNNWGELIFESEQGYPQKWNGRLNNQPLQTGIYAMTIDLKDTKYKLIRGTILLLL